MSRGYSYEMGGDSDMKGADSDVKRGLPMWHQGEGDIIIQCRCQFSSAQ